MESPKVLAESLLSLSERLKHALEQSQLELLATLLAERQGLLRALGGALQKGPPLTAEVTQALQESDSAFLQAVQSMQEGLGRELATNQGQQRATFTYRASSPATFLDKLG